MLRLAFQAFGLPRLVGGDGDFPVVGGCGLPSSCLIAFSSWFCVVEVDIGIDVVAVAVVGWLS